MTISSWIKKPKKHSWCFWQQPRMQHLVKKLITEWKNTIYQFQSAQVWKLFFWAIPSFGHIKYFNVSSKVFELMASALVYIKCQAIFYNTARDEGWYFGSYGILSFYFPPLELVHRVPCPNQGIWTGMNFTII